MSRRPLRARVARAVRELMGGMTDPTWKGAEVSPMTMDWRVALRNPNEELRPTLHRLRARGRDLRRNDPYARQFLNLFGTNVVGHRGFKHQAQIRGPAGELLEDLNGRLEAAWRDFSSAPVTTDRRLTLVEAEYLRLETLATDGEVFIRFFNGYPNRYGFALQFIDADQIDHEFNREARPGQNEIRMGVEVDAYGAPVGYWVLDQPYGYGFNYGGRRERYFVPAYDPRTGLGEMLHDFIPLRANQARGLTWFAPILLTAKMRMGMLEAELYASRLSAAKPIALQVRDGATDITITGENDPEKPPPVFNANPGEIPALPPGYELVGVNTDHPSAAFPNFMITILREYATALGVSYNALCNDLQTVNFSSMKTGLLAERGLWRKLQEREVRAFLQPVRDAWLRSALLRGAATGGAEGLVLDSLDWRRYREARFAPLGWPWPEPLKDAQASQLWIQLGLASRADLAAEEGKDWDEILEQLAREEARAKELGISIMPSTASADAAKTTADEEAAAQAAEAAKTGEGPNGNGRALPAALAERLLPSAVH